MMVRVAINSHVYWRNGVYRVRAYSQSGEKVFLQPTDGRPPFTVPIHEIVSVEAVNALREEDAQHGRPH